MDVASWSPTTQRTTVPDFFHSFHIGGQQAFNQSFATRGESICSVKEALFSNKTFFLAPNM